MITSNIIQKVLRVTYNGNSGSAFTIEVNDKQYLVSAKHIFPDIEENDTIQFFSGGIWNNLDVRCLFNETTEIDIIVFDIPQAITPQHELIPSMAGLVYSQDVYFLGFPYGFFTESGDLNNEYPFPFVKKGIVSAFTQDIIFIDGHNNKGFSGGPIVFYREHDKKLHVAGIVSGYYLDQKNTGELTLSVSENSGLFFGHNIDHAVNAINNDT